MRNSSKKAIQAADPYPQVSEQPGTRATPEQVSMLVTRYHLAALHARGRTVLEVACGSGMGLGYLARDASRVVGADYSPTLLDMAQNEYRGAIPLVRLDAHSLPFRDKSFDVVVLYEAIYYLTKADQFVEEARRILAPKGMLLICTANRSRSGFVRSPHAHRYFSAQELREILARYGFGVSILGAFPVLDSTTKDRVISVARRILVALDLVPATLKGREILKRLAYGKLHSLRTQVREEDAQIEPLVSVSPSDPDHIFKVIYAVATLA